MSEASKKQIILFWAVTIPILIAETGAGFSLVTGAERTVEGLAALGYPRYFLMILGPLKLAGVITLALPRLPRIKEWAYAGFGFDFLGAAASHIFNGDGPDKIVPPFLILTFLVGSYLLRPAERRLV